MKNHIYVITISVYNVQVHWEDNNSVLPAPLERSALPHTHTQQKVERSRKRGRRSTLDPKSTGLDSKSNSPGIVGGGVTVKGEQEAPNPTKSGALLSEGTSKADVCQGQNIDNAATASAPSKKLTGSTHMTRKRSSKGPSLCDVLPDRLSHTTALVDLVKMKNVGRGGDTGILVGGWTTGGWLDMAKEVLKKVMKHREAWPFLQVCVCVYEREREREAEDERQVWNWTCLACV